jgi:hypothetical protein
MVKAALLAPELEGLSGMTAEELTAALKRYIDGAGLVTASEVEVARRGAAPAAAGRVPVPMAGGGGSPCPAPREGRGAVAGVCEG